VGVGDVGGVGVGVGFGSAVGAGEGVGAGDGVGVAVGTGVGPGVGTITVDDELDVLLFVLEFNDSEPASAPAKDSGMRAGTNGPRPAGGVP
jgi:hypothetical protein